MGIQLWGAFGGFQKKTGALVGRWLNGQNVITAIPHPSKKPPTEAQLNQRAKFGMLVSFLRPISQIIKVGFKDAHAEKQSAWNAAFVHNFKRAITGTGPFTIDYPKMVYSMGILSPVYDPELVVDRPEIITFNWNGFTSGSGAATDMATFVVYSPIIDRYVCLTNAVPRSALTFELLMPPDYKGHEVYCYMSFVSANGKLTSNSSYLGKMPVL
jgi:hypothetical protein